MPIVGSFAGASARAYGLGAGGLVLEGFNSIATTTLGSSQATVTFSVIPQIYKHLQIRWNGGITTSDSWYYQLNGDTASNYSRHTFRGSSGGIDVYANANIDKGFGGFITAGTNLFASGVMDILDYTNTNKYKTVRNMCASNANGSGFIHFDSTNWRNTNAVTSITLRADANGYSWKQYSSFALYGIVG
jgi:hypothetical protein